LENLKGRDIWKTSAKWEDNTEMYIKEKWCDGVDLINLTHDEPQWRALTNMIMKLRVSYSAANCFINRVTINSSTRTLLH